MPYSGYEELNELPPEAFLEWQQFETEFDALASNVNRAAEQYTNGLNIGQKYRTIHICTNSTWSASGGPNGGVLTSYEGIGYHACTKDLLHGFLDSEAEVLVHRWGQDKPVSIKSSKPDRELDASSAADIDVFDQEFRT